MDNLIISIVFSNTSSHIGTTFPPIPTPESPEDKAHTAATIPAVAQAML